MPNSDVDEKTAEPFLRTIDPADSETVETLREKSKTKPYHAAMRILLYVWSWQRRRLAEKQLRELKALQARDNLQQITDLIVTAAYSDTKLLWENLNVKDYYMYVNRHKHYVTVGFEIFNELVINSVKSRLFSEGFLGDARIQPEQNPTEEQIKQHDDSKYSFVETVTYAMQWYPCCGMGKCDDEAWETGLKHHYCHNEHHPEYWGNSQMYWRFIVEAMYDMAAMELEKRFKGSLPDNRAYLLQFDPKFLRRFEMTGQLLFAQKLIRYTMEAYCSRYALPMPPDLESSASAVN